MIDFLAAAIAAVKDGSEPRIQLEMALLKATQPQADLSLQALMFRIEQLEARLGEGARPPSRRRSAPAPAALGPPSRPRPLQAPHAQRRAGRSAAVAAEPEAEEQPVPVGAVDLEQLQAIWPAVAEAVTEENGMLGAALGAARPMAVEAERLTVAFPPDAAFVKKKAEANRELVQRAVRGLTGHTLAVDYELREDATPAGPALLGEAGADRTSAGGVRRRGSLRRRGALGDGRPAQHERHAQAGPEDAGRHGQGSGRAEERGGRGQRRRRHGHLKITGDLEIRELRIDPEAVDPEDVELLQDMVLAAVNEGVRSAQELAATKMSAATGGLGGPGGLGGLGLPGF